MWLVIISYNDIAYHVLYNALSVIQINFIINPESCLGSIYPHFTHEELRLTGEVPCLKVTCTEPVLAQRNTDTVAGPAGRRGHGGRFCSTRWGAPRGPPIQGPGLQGCPGACREVKGRSSQRQHCSGISVLDVTPTPKPHRPLTPHQLLQTCSTPVVAPIQKGLPRHRSPCSTLSHRKPYQIPSGCQAKPRWGAGRGGKGKEGASPCSGPLLTGLQSNSPTTEPLIMPFFVVAQS